MKKAKRNATTIAKQMCYVHYMPDVMERIASAKTENQVTEILHECRRRWQEADYASL